MSGRRKVLLILAVFSTSLLLYMPVIVEKPRPLFEQSISGLPTSAFPTFAVLGILVLSILEFVRRDKGRPATGGDSHGEISVASILVALALILLSASAWERLGYLAISLLIAASLSLWMGNRNFISILMVSVVFPASVYWLVTRVLSTYLPAGRVLHDFLS